jgi:hypothetical protein
MIRSIGSVKVRRHVEGLETVDKLLTPREAVLKSKELLGGSDVTEAYLRVLRATKKGPAYYKIRSRIFYREADLEAWLKPTRIEHRFNRSAPG